MNSSFRTSAIARLLLVAAICLPAIGYSAAIYTTGFEGPTFTSGALSGQDGWAVANGASVVTVQNSIVHSGSQAAEVDDSQTNTSLLIAFHAASNGGQPDVFLSDYAFFSSSATPSVWAPLGAFDGTQANIVNYVIETTGQIHIDSGATHIDTGVFVSQGVWENFGLLLDFSAGTGTAYLNGSVVASGFAFTGDGALGVAGFGQYTPGNDQMYVDDFSAQAVPGPASAALVLIGGVAFAMLPKRRAA
jgi:hypothetical protein